MWWSCKAKFLMFMVAHSVINPFPPVNVSVGLLKARRKMVITCQRHSLAYFCPKGTKTPLFLWEEGIVVAWWQHCCEYYGLPWTWKTWPLTIMHAPEFRNFIHHCLLLNTEVFVICFWDIYVTIYVYVEDCVVCVSTVWRPVWKETSLTEC